MSSLSSKYSHGRLHSVPRCATPTARVLIVDDEEAIRHAIALAVEDEGYTPLEAANGKEALALPRAAPTLVVVLLDFMMPVMDGLEVLRTVAEEPKQLGQHAYVFMSGAFPAGLSQLAELSTDVRASVLIKPFTIALLLDKVAEAVTRIAEGERSDTASDTNVRRHGRGA